MTLVARADATFLPSFRTVVSQTARVMTGGTLPNVSSIFDYAPHPHIERRKAAGPPKVAAAVAQIHGPGPVGRFNAKIGLKITIIVGTMWCAYLFTILALVSSPSAFSSGNTLTIVAWIAQTFLQLVLLPIIIVGQNVQATAADARAQATYDDAAAILEEAKQIQAHLQAQDDALERIIARLPGASG